MIIESCTFSSGSMKSSAFELKYHHFRLSEVFVLVLHQFLKALFSKIPSVYFINRTFKSIMHQQLSLSLSRALKTVIMILLHTTFFPFKLYFIQCSLSVFLFTIHCCCCFSIHLSLYPLSMCLLLTSFRNLNLKFRRFDRVFHLHG